MTPLPMPPQYAPAPQPITVAGMTLDDLASLSLIVLVAMQVYDRFWGRHAGR